MQVRASQYILPDLTDLDQLIFEFGDWCCNRCTRDSQSVTYTSDKLHDRIIDSCVTTAEQTWWSGVRCHRLVDVKLTASTLFPTALLFVSGLKISTYFYLDDLELRDGYHKV